ncbi:hypothetical protein H2200_013608 [Cladophialophora chaetospira]|uniref:Uncharacterized protein n=1 Tax=Cladophialophora chaetospira TaxID=386627 RepID=A0AA38TX56_9EURO|nr:hypothetical protein H2200_013608 [Cladophialophora chaetospira]
MTSPTNLDPRANQTALFSELPNMKSILRQVDELQHAIDQDIIERLTEENNLLRKGVEQGTQRLPSIAALFQEAWWGYAVLDRYLEDFENVTQKAMGDFDMSLLQDTTAGQIDAGESTRGLH